MFELIVYRDQCFRIFLTDAQVRIFLGYVTFSSLEDLWNRGEVLSVDGIRNILNKVTSSQSAISGIISCLIQSGLIS